MKNDKGLSVQKAFPGEAIHLTGFKHLPDVGNPLYVVSNCEEAKFIINQIKHRATLSKLDQIGNQDEAFLVHDMMKSIGKLTKSEKIQIKKGDKSVLYEKLGLLEDKDLKNYQTKYGIKDYELSSEDELAEVL